MLLSPSCKGMEWFNALRRLGKIAWLLQYDGEAHSLLNPINELDFTVRLEQFFGHYLKGRPAPLWMTQGVSAEAKGTASAN